MTTPIPKGYVDINEIMARTGLSRKTILRAIKETGELPAKEESSRRVLVEEQVADQWIAKRQLLVPIKPKDQK